MAGEVRCRSSSCPSIDKDDGTSNSGISSRNGQHAQSSDSLLSLSQSTGLDPSARSDMSLPEFDGTVVDSEGYSSFRSNYSSCSSPFSSNNTSPTGDSDLFVDTLDANSVSKRNSSNVDNKSWQFNQSSNKRQGDYEINDGLMQDRNGFYTTKENESLNVIETRGEKANLSVKTRHHSVDDDSMVDYTVSGVSIKRLDSNVLRNDNNNVELSKSGLGPLLLERRMSTIEECFEETPSPRSGIEIDKNFANAYKSNVWQNVLRANGQSQEMMKETASKADTDSGESIIGAPSCGTETAISKDSKSNEPRMDAGGASHDDCRKEESHDSTSSNELPEEFASKFPKGFLSSPSSKMAYDVYDLSALSEQAFDIDLDLYEIPIQRRQSLELKLSDLRKFVDRIIADRKCLEKDRLFLQQTLQSIESQRYESSRGSNLVSLPNEDSGKGGGKRDRGAEINKEYEKCSTEASEKADYVNGCKLSCQNNKGTVNQASNFNNEFTSSDMAQKTDFEELLCSLEEALLENIELKHMNKDLVNVNEELRERIEELLTDEEELRYKLNESMLKLMEDSERQRDENVVLRSNFNKVLRDYNSLEEEFKELEQNYEDLINNRDLLINELSVKNEDYQLCKDECVRLTDELDRAKEQLDNYDRSEERVWTRSDWEQWTVLQTKISATELALFDARKQKAQLVNDLKRMKKVLEAGKDRIEEAEKAINQLEKNLKGAQERNELLQNQNEDLRHSILEYETKLAEFDKMADERIPKNESQHENCNVEEENEDEGAKCNFKDWIEIKSKDIEEDACVGDEMLQIEEEGLSVNPTILRGDAKSASIRRARTFPFNEMETLALRLFQDAASHADTFADSQYQSAFQEVRADHSDGANKNDDDDDDYDERPVMMKESLACASSNTLVLQRDAAEKLDDCGKRKSSHRHTFSFKALLPSLLQSVLNAKSKKGKQKSPSKTRDHF